MVIKRVGPLSIARIIGLLYAILGLIFGACVSLIAISGGFATAAFGANPSAPSALPFFFGVSAIALLPIFYRGLGFVFTLIGAWLYNALAGLVGGIELDLQ